MPRQPSDPFDQLARDIKAHAVRLKEKPPASLAQLATEFSGTGLEFTGEVLQLIIQLRAWMYEQMNTLAERLDELAEPTDSVIVPEDAEKLSALFSSVDELIKQNLALNPADQVKAALVELQALNQECATIVEESTLEEEGDDGEEEGDEDEPEEGEDEEPEEGAPELPAGAP